MTLPVELDFLAILKCPISGNDIHELSPSEVEALNIEIGNASLFNYEGSAVTQPVERALASSCERYFYRIQEGVIVLLENLAMVRQADLNPNDNRSGLMSDKKAVQDFYNQFGWKKNDEGVFQ